ncbi:MAG: DNA repair protein RadC [Candidatus Paceibacterota bacterium]
MSTTGYNIVSKPLILGNVNHKYVLTVRDLPNEEKPREKMLQGGPDILSVIELLAIVFGQGTRREDVLNMSNRIVSEYGERNIFSQKSAEKLSKDLDIPITKAMQVVAVGELGRRFFERKKNGAVVVRTAGDVFEYVADMVNLPKEYLRGIYLNSHYQVVHDEVISIGTVDSSIIHPREVFRPALSCSATAVILVHNHPSGILEASKQDKDVTKQIKEAGDLIGIQLVDHLIVTKDGFISIDVG